MVKIRLMEQSWELALRDRCQILMSSAYQSQAASENSVEGDETLLEETTLQMIQAQQMKIPEQACVAKLRGWLVPWGK